MPGTTKSDWIVAKPLIHLAEAAEAMGISCAPLLAESNLSSLNRENSEEHLGIRDVFSAFERIVAAMGNDAATLDIFSRAPVGHASIIDYVFLYASSLEEGLNNWARFCPVRSNGLTVEYAVEDRFGILDFKVPDHFGPNSQFTFGFIALFCSRVEMVVNQEPPPFRIEIAAKAPQNLSDFQRRYSSRITFDTHKTRLFIPERLLPISSSKADPSLFRIIEAAALDRLSAVSGFDTQTSIIAAKISQGLRTGECSIDYVASQMGMSSRSLQRNLEREGTNYRTVMDDVRRSVAERYLVDTNRPIKEIAFLLGFSEISAFSRAVRNWFGIPPRELRQRTLTAPLSSDPGP